MALGQPNVQARIDVGRQLANSIDANIQEIQVVEKGQRVGSVTAWNGEEIALLATEDAATVLTLDEQATLNVEFDPIQAGTPGGTEVGVVTVSTPTGVISIPVELEKSIPEPDMWWRLGHPVEVLGWR